MSTSRRPTAPEGAVLATILVLFALLGVAYSLVVPAFEKPDELYHYAFARHLAEGNDLPVQSIGNLGPWEHEGTQAPLYYFLVGRLTAGIDQRDFGEINTLNPRANMGDPLYPGNKNLMLYSAAPRPLTGANLALRIGRWFSLALGTLTLAIVYLTARLAFPRRPGARLFATLIVATIPQFAFISSAVSNDSLVIFLSAAGLYWLARIAVRDRTEPVHEWEWVVAGTLLGLVALSKLQGLALLVPIGVVAVWAAWQRRSVRVFVSALALVAIPSLAIAGWWYWRNLTLYGDLLGAERLLQINGMRQDRLTWAGFRGEMRGLRYSFWGLFGWFNILLPTWVYRVLDAVTIAAVTGFAVGGAKALAARRGAVLAEPATRVRALLAFWAVTLIAAMIYWATFATSSQGRLLFPALSAFGVILVSGLLVWLDLVPRMRWPALALLPALLVGCSAYALLSLLPAAYQAPRSLAGVPASAARQEIVFAGEIELLGVTLPNGRFRPGEDVPVTLYLRGRDALSVDRQLFVQLLDENREAIGNVTTHPGWGRLPATLWEPGAIYEDRYLVRIEKPVDNKSPLLATVYVGLTEPDSTDPAPATDKNGQPADGMLGHVEVEAWDRLDIAELGLRTANAVFEQGIRIAGAAFPEQIPAGTRELPVSLLYEADTRPDQDYTAFLHLRDSAGTQVVGFDQPPGGARFPTRAWREGDQVLSEFRVDLPEGLPPGEYRIWAGLYPTGSQGSPRLGVQASDGAVENQSVLLGIVEIR